MRHGHGEIKIVGDACVLGCGRPARELGGHCTRCWLALTTAERAHLQWLEEVDRGARAAAAAREVRDLDELLELDLDKTMPDSEWRS